MRAVHILLSGLCCRESLAAAFAGSAVQEIIDKAIADGLPSVELPAGDVDFEAAPLVIAGAKNLAVIGQGAGANGTSFWFSPGYGVEIVDSANVTLRDVSSDTSSPPFSQSTLVSFDKSTKSAVIDVHADFPLPDSALFNQTCPDGLGVCGEVKTIYWDPKTTRIVSGQEMGIPMAEAHCDANRRCEVIFRAVPSWTPPAGSWVTLSPRIGASKYPIPSYYRGAFLVQNSSSVLLQDIDVHSSGTMVLLENLGAGGHVYRRFNIRRRPSAPYPLRLLATNSDGFHSFSVEQGPTLEDCEFSFLGDDFINLHDRLLPLASLDVQDRVLRLVDPGAVLGHGGATTHTMPLLRPGDELKLYNLSDQKLLASVTLSSAKELPRSEMPALPQALAGRVQPEARSYWEVAFEDMKSGAPPPVEAFGGLVQVDRFSSAGGVAQRNYFHDSYNNAGRFAASNFMFRDNKVERCEDGFHVSYDIAKFNFLEGSLGMRNISLVNNSFHNVFGRGDGSPRLCTDMACVLAHVDEGLKGIVHESDNTVSTESLALALV